MDYLRIAAESGLHGLVWLSITALVLLAGVVLYDAVKALLKRKD